MRLERRCHPWRNRCDERVVRAAPKKLGNLQRIAVASAVENNARENLARRGGENAEVVVV